MHSTHFSHLTLLKLGGALITDKSQPMTFQPQVMQRLAKEISHIVPKLEGGLLIGHGQGSFGHVLVDKYKLRQGLQAFGGEGTPIGLAESWYGIQQLHTLVQRSLLDAQVPVISLPVHALGVSKVEKAPVVFTESLNQALHTGFIPLLTGDIVLDTKQGSVVWSTERIFTELVKHYREHKPHISLQVIFVTNVPGVLDDQGEVIPEISAASAQSILHQVTGSNHTDVTGGMRKKLETALHLAALGAEVSICADTALQDVIEHRPEAVHTQVTA